MAFIFGFSLLIFLIISLIQLSNAGNPKHFENAKTRCIVVCKSQGLKFGYVIHDDSAPDGYRCVCGGRLDKNE